MENDAQFLRWLKQRFPSWAEIFSVYSVIVFCSYTYGLVIYAYNVPSWILMVPLGELLGYFSYGMILLFLDTFLLLMLVLAMTALLPRKWFLVDFAAIGSAVAGVLFFWIILIQLAYTKLVTMPASWLEVFLGAAFLIHLVFAMLAVKRLTIFRKAVLWFASSAALFVYIYGFLTALGIVVVLIRNIF